MSKRVKLPRSQREFAQMLEEQYKQGWKVGEAAQLHRQKTAREEAIRLATEDQRKTLNTLLHLAENLSQVSDAITKIVLSFNGHL